MSAPAVPIPAARAMRGKAKQGVDRTAGFVEAWLRTHTLLVYAFLYIPIIVVVVYSFNGTDQRVMDWEGFSLRWYEYVAQNNEVQRYLLEQRDRRPRHGDHLDDWSARWRPSGCSASRACIRLPFDALTYVSVIVPELVIALATLVFFASTIGREGFLTNATGITIGFGYHTIIGALSLFNISLTLLLVRARLSGMDRTHVEASYDLYATPLRTFWQITFPQLLPAIVAGFLLSFTFAFDDYLITTFVNGQGTSTLPLYVFGQIKRGVTPATNVVADADAPRVAHAADRGPVAARAATRGALVARPGLARAAWPRSSRRAVTRRERERRRSGAVRPGPDAIGQRPVHRGAVRFVARKKWSRGVWTFSHHERNRALSPALPEFRSPHETRAVAGAWRLVVHARRRMASSSNHLVRERPWRRRRGTAFTDTPAHRARHPAAEREPSTCRQPRWARGPGSADRPTCRPSTECDMRPDHPVLRNLGLRAASSAQRVLLSPTYRNRAHTSGRALRPWP